MLGAFSEGFLQLLYVVALFQTEIFVYSFLIKWLVLTSESHIKEVSSSVAWVGIDHEAQDLLLSISVPRLSLNGHLTNNHRDFIHVRARKYVYQAKINKHCFYAALFYAKSSKLSICQVKKECFHQFC